ncbi:carbamoyl-phosphate synthase large subunit [Streptomyces sp. F001]|uniref:carboxyl transferase domain-containing protein n=1 Tax=Streptomyces sp. F001 TaxID=1510026 RepID=UPI00101E2A5C|nr:carboxyl transferase domain-containing protein [Streptomyces sp. F001]RZB15481.1 carbamoyl-phosphate synthase large subunit [Streptomyces sp. F001]
MNSLSSVLIANRGEIAVRIHRAAATLGLRTVAVFSREDRDALHARLADEAHLLAGEGVAAYLDAGRIVEIARRAGCELVHPGYGFLSENAEFAQVCAEAGLTFVGPSPELLGLFGDKARSRELAAQHAVPVLAATPGGASLEEAKAFTTGLGPGAGVMVKALAGGGGRGMRAVFDADELPWAYERCRSEAERAFGNGEVYVEQLLPRAKHIEIQVIGDGTGAVTHLWERECTVQRRHQKLIEIAPSPWLPAGTRDALIKSAVTMASATRYRGLGTFEFLVDADSPETYYFIETNPRLQVEHTITEELTGVDLVVAQLQVAVGRTLADQGLLQDDIQAPRGFAIQSRVNLEEIARDGSARASAGTLAVFEPPGGPGVRVDTHGRTGLRVSGAFDSLLAKVVTRTVRGDFADAAARADNALLEFAVTGAATNVPLLRSVLQHPVFRDAAMTTTFVDDHLDELVPADAGEAGAAPDATGDGAVLAASFPGSVVAVEVRAGDEVRAGAPLLVLEAMKMEHVLTAPSSGRVRDVRVAVGDVVSAGLELVVLTPADVADEVGEEAAEVDLEEIRPDLSEVIERHRIGLDEARPQAVERRRRTGHRTARENLADLCGPDGFTEYGALVIAAQRQRRSLDDLIAHTPADGLVAGIGRVNGEQFGADRSQCVVMSYDYTVLAGTQGKLNHKKTDRMLELAEKRRLPVVLFAEGGGGRPGDTDTTSASGLDVLTFSTMGRLSGLVPTVGIASGRCFAGNAALLGCCDVIIATSDTTLGMGGPAMIEGGGLGQFLPEEVGPMSVQVPNGVVDILVEDEQEAVAVAKKYLSYFQGVVDAWDCADQRRLRHVIPENRVRVYDVREAIDLLADTGSVLELRTEFGIGVITALVRIEGRPMGLVANNPGHLGGAIDSPAADKMARFLQLCDAHGLPVVSLCDTPGFMVGPDAETTATVRHFSRLFVAGANLSVPVFSVVLRKGYGLGAQAMAGGSFRNPVAMVAWPTGEIGGMGLEGAVRLGYRRELDAIGDSEARQQAFDELLAEQYAKGKAVNAATVFELDDVIDPAETRRWITNAFTPYAARPFDGRRRSFVDTW